MPYMYNTQPSVLLEDIRDFHENENTISYLAENDDQLFHHILTFCNTRSETRRIYLVHILERSYYFPRKTYAEKVHYINNHFHALHQNKYPTRAKNKCIIGLFTPYERMQFINRLLLS